MAIERGKFKGTAVEAVELLYAFSRSVPCVAKDREVLEGARTTAIEALVDKEQQPAAAADDTQESDSETGD